MRRTRYRALNSEFTIYMTCTAGRVPQHSSWWICPLVEARLDHEPRLLYYLFLHSISGGDFRMRAYYTLHFRSSWMGSALRMEGLPHRSEGALWPVLVWLYLWSTSVEAAI